MNLEKKLKRNKVHKKNYSILTYLWIVAKNIDLKEKEGRISKGEERKKWKYNKKKGLNGYLPVKIYKEPKT